MSEHSHTHTHVDENGHVYEHSHGHHHSHAQTKAVLNRLSRAQGHLDAVRKMVERGEDCTEVLVQRNKEVQMAAHDFGKGRAVYISGVPYSFANSRTLYRAILWSAHSEEELHTWFSSNYNVEVHAYVKNGKYCVVNNTYEPQDTTVYTTDGSSFALHLDANEIKWYEI